MQTRELREYCDRRGWALAGEFVDAGISGSKERRPELDRLMADAQRRKFDVIIVWKFDRFARSVSHLLRALENFQALNIQFVSLTEGIDTSKDGLHRPGPGRRTRTFADRGTCESGNAQRPG
jgi:DNA invertase Pin-like site-specific DNA recombinase